MDIIILYLTNNAIFADSKQYKKMKKILFSFLTIGSLVLSACNGDDNKNDNNQSDDSLKNPFIGVFEAGNVTCTYNNGSGTSGEYNITITQAVNGTANQIAIKNLSADDNVYPATINNNSFTITQNSGNVTGTGSLLADGKTIEFSYQVPAEGANCNGVATKK